MQTINAVQKLMDEMAVFTEISKEIPSPYNVILNQKIHSLNTYLNKILSIESEPQDEVYKKALEILSRIELEPNQN